MTMTTPKRIGYFFFCLVPLCITVSLQLLLSLPAAAIAGILTFLQGASHDVPLDELLPQIQDSLVSSSFTVALSAAYGSFALLIFGIWYQKRFASREERLPLTRSCNAAIIGSLALLALGGQYVTTYLVSAVATLFPHLMEQYETLLQSINAGQPSPLLIVYACIIAPISEECIFRGVVYGYAKKALPVAWAICYQAILFGVFHMNLMQGIYVAFFGLILGFVREYGGSLVYPVILHVFFNFIGTFLNNYLFYGMEQPFFFLLFLTIGVLATFAGIFLFQYGIHNLNHYEE